MLRGCGTLGEIPTLCLEPSWRIKAASSLTDISGYAEFLTKSEPAPTYIRNQGREPVIKGTIWMACAPAGSLRREGEIIVEITVK
jgi:hypothetical protein